MHRLLPLIALLQVLSLTPKTFAAGGSLSTSLQSQKETRLNEIPIQSQTQSFQIESPTILENIKLNTSIQNQKTDLSTRLLTLKNGATQRLDSIDDGKRQILGLGIEFQLKSTTLTASHSQDVKTSVFATRTHQVGILQSFYSGATQVGLQIQNSIQNQPESYFIDPGTLGSEQRVQRIESQKYQIHFEQILSESWRAKISVFQNKTLDYRPDNNGITVSNAFAVDSRWSLRADLGIAQNNRQQSIFDDRGYFQAAWLDTELLYEMQLDRFIGFGWSTISETENDPRNNRNQRLGTDTFGVLFEIPYQNLNFRSQLASSVNSENQSGSNLYGEVQWQF